MKTPAQIQIAINSMERDQTFCRAELENIMFGRVDLIASERQKEIIQKIRKYIEKIEMEKGKITFRLPMLDEYKSTLEQIKAQLENNDKQ